MQMNSRDKARSAKIEQAILSYQANTGLLPGLSNSSRTQTLAAQIVDSLRRIEFAYHIRDAKHDPARLDPATEIFDPLRAAVLHNREGRYDEAWWLVFLGTHFGKHSEDRWRLSRDVYGKLGQGGLWDWAAVSRNPLAFRGWFAANESILRGADGISRRFSNHRKFESLNASSSSGTASVLISYVNWVSPPKTHLDIVRECHRSVGQNPHTVFQALYKSMDTVRRFGRLGKFDFLAMLGKLGIAPVAPGSTFLNGASGPLKGARLLFGGNPNSNLSANELETKLVAFGQHTNIGAQAIEDALCNWQKQPGTYTRFRG